MKKRLTGGRVAAYIALCVVPLFELLLGLIMLLAFGFIVNVSFALTYFVVPIMTAVTFVPIVFSDSKRWKKVIFSFIIVVLSIVIFLFGARFGLSESIEHYEDQDALSRYGYAEIVMANVPADVGDPVSMDYYGYIRQNLLIFIVHADYLFCEYTEDEYTEQKALLDEKYVFHDDPIGYSEPIEPTAELDGYVFRLLNVKDRYSLDGIYYPSNLLFIGTNDETHEIVYISFRDNNSYYPDSLADLLLKKSGWEHIR